MLSAQNWFIIGVIGFSIAGILFVIAIFLFAYFKMPKIIGDLTGRNESKQIEKMKKTKMKTDNTQLVVKNFSNIKVTETLTEKTIILGHQTKFLYPNNKFINTEDIGEQIIDFKIIKSIIVVNTEEVIV